MNNLSQKFNFQINFELEFYLNAFWTIVVTNLMKFSSDFVSLDEVGLFPASTCGDFVPRWMYLRMFSVMEPWKEKKNIFTKPSTVNEFWDALEITTKKGIFTIELNLGF